MISTNGASTAAAVVTNMTRSFQEHLAFNQIGCNCKALAFDRHASFVLASLAERDIPERHYFDCPCGVAHVAWKIECQRQNALYRRVFACTRKDGSFVDNKIHESEEKAWAHAVETFADREASKGPNGVRDWVYISSFWERTGP